MYVSNEVVHFLIVYKLEWLLKSRNTVDTEKEDCRYHYNEGFN